MSTPVKSIAYGISLTATPMGHLEATAQAKLLLSSYPREPHNPEIFVTGIVQVLAEYPSEIGRVAIDALTRRLKFYPTRADLVEALEEAMRPIRHRHAQEMAAAQMQQRRAAQTIKEMQIEADRQALRSLLGEAWGPWWSIPRPRRYDGGSPAQFAEGWNAAVDKSVFVDAWGCHADKVEACSNELQ